MIRSVLRASSALVAAVVLGASASATPVIVNALTIPGDAVDLSPATSDPNQNRLGGFASDLYYDRFNNVFFGLVDRGPGGGVISYETRVQQFTLNVNAASGAISNFQVTGTTRFTDAGTPFNGLNPQALNGSPSTLGRSFDPEGFVMSRTGTYFVSDEYGPTIREFRPDGTLIRTFATPANLVPRDNASTVNYVAERTTTPPLVTGRQDNRGFEGLAISPDGTKLYAMLQDPLAQEGSSNQGRRSQNVRMVEFDVATGTQTRQFVYQLEAIADINARIPGSADDFGATNQGRSIGISAVYALNDHQFLVLERDNRGVGNEDSGAPIGSKRIYLIDINGASDVTAVSLAGTNTLPGGVVPVSKSLFVDIQAALAAAGLPIFEKYEGMTFGPMLADGSITLILGTDNDFSVTQTGAGTQFDVCTSTAAGARSYTQVAIGAPCPTDYALIPSALYAFVVPAAELAALGYVAQEIAEPAPLAMLLVALFGGALLRRRRAARAAT